MAYVCLDCGEIFKDFVMRDIEKHSYEIPRPINSCIGTVVEINELLIPTIQIINKKGYATKFCCAGHVYDSSSTYICFEDCVESFNNIPKGFELEKSVNGTSLTIRKLHRNYMKTPQRFKEINKASITLLEWAMSLPECED